MSGEVICGGRLAAGATAWQAGHKVLRLFVVA